MKEPFKALLLALAVTGQALVMAGCADRQSTEARPMDSFNQRDLRITSPAFDNGQAIPVKYTCDGENANPPLKFRGVPEATKTLALVVDDPDAPAHVFNHWILFNIPAEVKGIDEKTTPAQAMMGENDAKLYNYTGPCPPPTTGMHHYRFRLYALDGYMNLATGAQKEALLDAMKGHVLDQAELVGTYARQQSSRKPD